MAERLFDDVLEDRGASTVSLKLNGVDLLFSDAMIILQVLKSTQQEVFKLLSLRCNHLIELISANFSLKIFITHNIFYSQCSFCIGTQGFSGFLDAIKKSDEALFVRLRVSETIKFILNLFSKSLKHLNVEVSSSKIAVRVMEDDLTSDMVCEFCKNYRSLGLSYVDKSDDLVLLKPLMFDLMFIAVGSYQCDALINDLSFDISDLERS